jgi:hypothetical protein
MRYQKYLLRGWLKETSNRRFERLSGFDGVGVRFAERGGCASAVWSLCQRARTGSTLGWCGGGGSVIGVFADRVGWTENCYGRRDPASAQNLG